MNFPASLRLSFMEQQFSKAKRRQFLFVERTS